MLPLAYPVRGGDGRAAGMVIAAAQLDRFQSLVAALELPERPTSLILKEEGLVIASSRDPDRYVRIEPLVVVTMRSPGPWSIGAAGLRGTFHSMASSNASTGFIRFQGRDWLAVVGLRSDSGKVVSSALRHGAYGLGVLVLALALSFAGRRISAPIAAVARAAHAFGEGRREVRSPVSGAREVAEVAVQLNRSSAS